MALLTVAEFDYGFVQHRRALENYARFRGSREDVEDLVSACYMQARGALNAYRHNSDLLAWLIGILENQMRLHFRRIRQRREDFVGIGTSFSDCEDTGEAEAAKQAQQFRSLCRHLAAVDMTARQYECVMLALHGATRQQISDIMGISYRAVGYHLQAAQEHVLDFIGVTEEWDTTAFFYECADHPIYRKPHSFDNQSNSVEREQHRYACLREERRTEKRKRKKEVSM